MPNPINEERFPVRKNPRLKQFDYASRAYYFVTICAKNKACIFGSPQALSNAGSIAEAALQSTETHFPTVKVDKFVVMPNHVHAIIILEEGSPGLSAIVGQYKAAVTKHIHKWDPAATVWQTSFHDHIIRNQADYQRIWQYIDTNPVKWSEDCFYTP